MSDLLRLNRALPVFPHVLSSCSSNTILQHVPVLQWPFIFNGYIVFGPCHPDKVFTEMCLWVRVDHEFYVTRAEVLDNELCEGFYVFAALMF